MSTVNDYAKEFGLPARSLELLYGNGKGELACSIAMLFDKYRDAMSLVLNNVTEAEWTELINKSVIQNELKALVATLPDLGYSSDDLYELMFCVWSIRYRCFFRESIPNEYSEITEKLIGMGVQDIILKCDELKCPIEELGGTDLSRFVSKAAKWFLISGYIPEAVDRARLILLSTYTDLTADWYKNNREGNSL